MITAGIIIVGLLWIIGVILAESDEGTFPFFLGVMLTTAAFLLVVVGMMGNGSYMEGQIDAINGVIKYELQEQENASVRWVEVKE